MMNSGKQWVVILAVVLGLVAVQGVWAQDYEPFELTGTINSCVWGERGPTYIEFDTLGGAYIIYGVNCNTFCECKGIDPEKELTIEGIIVTLKSGEEKYVGCSVSQDEDYLELNNRYKDDCP